MLEKDKGRIPSVKSHLSVRSVRTSVPPGRAHPLTDSESCSKSSFSPSAEQGEPFGARAKNLGDKRKGALRMRVKRRIFSGAVCEQEVFTVSDGLRNLRKAEKRLRFHSDEERQQHRNGIARRHHARNFNANFNPESLYSTLTMDNEHEVHTFEEAKRIRKAYIRKLKKRWPDAVIYAYLGRGKSTQRIHMHMVSNGIPKEAITSLWECGTVSRCENLRKKMKSDDGRDLGMDYTGLANYLFDHWTPEQGGHRWYQTRNAQKAEKEEPVACKREYTEAKPPRAPKGYRLTEARSTPYGYLYFKYVCDDAPSAPPGRRELIHI